MQGWQPIAFIKYASTIWKLLSICYEVHLIKAKQTFLCKHFGEAFHEQFRSTAIDKCMSEPPLDARLSTWSVDRQHTYFI